MPALDLDFSQITESLYVGRTPFPKDYSALRDLGINLVINMRWERPPYRDAHNPPMPTLWLPTFDTPLIPIPIRALRKGVNAALETLAAGQSVYAHCAQGRHRGVAMGACILIAQGYPVEEALRLLKEQRAAADPDAWYIRRRILRFAKSWRGQ